MEPGKLYRISKIADDPALRGQAVTFLGWVKQPWDIRRAKVRLVRNDTEYLVTSAIVINF